MLEDLVQEAHNVLSTHEKDITKAASSESEPPYRIVELLQCMLDYAPSNEGKRYVSTAIILAAQEEEEGAKAIVSLARAWADHLLLPSALASVLIKSARSDVESSSTLTVLAISRAYNIVPNPIEALFPQDANGTTSDSTDHQRLQKQVSSSMRSLDSQGA